MIGLYFSAGVLGFYMYIRFCKIRYNKKQELEQERLLNNSRIEKLQTEIIYDKLETEIINNKLETEIINNKKENILILEKSNITFDPQGIVKLEKKIIDEKISNQYNRSSVIEQNKNVIEQKKNYVSDWEKLKNILCHREYQVTNELFVDNQTGAFSNMNGAGILLFNSNYSKILLVCDSRSSKWSFPKGRFEKNETVRDTAIREMQEETEFEYPVDYQFVIWPAFKVFQYYIFIGKLNDNENVNSKIFIPNIEQHIKDIKWFDKNEIRQLKKYEMNLVTFTIINEWKNI